MQEIRAKDLLGNLKNFDSWDYQNYPLSKDEADACIQVLEIYLNGSVKRKIDSLDDDSESCGNA